MAVKIDHIAIVVSDLEDGIDFYGATVGLGAPIRKAVPELGLRLAFFTEGNGTIVELVEFSGRSDLAQGDVVVAIEVEDLDQALAHFRARGVRVFDQPPTENLPLRRGWMLKKDGRGTVIELCPKGEVARFVHSETARAS